MISIWDEAIVALKEATKFLPKRRSGKRPHVSCLYRWGRYGYRGIKLEVIRVGGTLCTSKEAIQRFVERTTAADPVIGEANPDPASPADQTDIERELDEMGL